MEDWLSSDIIFLFLTWLNFPRNSGDEGSGWKAAALEAAVSVTGDIISQLEIGRAQRRLSFPLPTWQSISDVVSQASFSSRQKKKNGTQTKERRLD